MVSEPQPVVSAAGAHNNNKKGLDGVRASAGFSGAHNNNKPTSAPWTSGVALSGLEGDATEQASQQ